MTNLPATFNEANEAAARARARELVKEMRESPYGSFHPDAERLYGKRLMKWWAQAHPFGADAMVYFAENGNKQAHEALQELIAESLHRDEKLPPTLAAYEIRLKNPFRQRKPGPAKADHAHFIRDIGIVVILGQLEREFRLSPNHKNRNPSGRATAPSILADALTEAKIGIVMTAKNVERIRRRYLPALLPTPAISGLFDQSY